MKTKIISFQEVGQLEIDLKYITCLIEFIVRPPNRQVTLRLEKIIYKMKDAQERREHAVDYLLPNAQKSIKNRILNMELPKIKKPKFIWYTR